MITFKTSTILTRVATMAGAIRALIGLAAPAKAGVNVTFSVFLIGGLGVDLEMVALDALLTVDVAGGRALVAFDWVAVVAMTGVSHTELYRCREKYFGYQYSM